MIQRTNIRKLCMTACLAAAAWSACNAGAPAFSPTTVTLLGTAGGPGGLADRSGIATLLTVEGKHYLIDAGEGVDRQLARAGLAERDVRVVFLTHLHDDHTAGLGALATFSYTLKSGPLEILGPPGTARLAAALRSYLQVSADIRGAERPMPVLEKAVLGRDVATGGVYKGDDVIVTAVENSHYHFPVGSKTGGTKSYSYRFKTSDRVVVFTGDTGPSHAVLELARGADLLVSEMVSAKDVANVPPEVVSHMLQEHMSPAEVGKLAQAAGVKQLVLSHLRSATESDLAEIRRYFSGPVALGQDLDRY